MKIGIISGNPKTDGLCHAIGSAIIEGIREAGAVPEELRLCDSDMIDCRVCGNGWGPCRADHRCAFEEDGFGAAQSFVRDCDALVLITPVYWGECSEALKRFLDRIRRCEFGASGAFSGKQILLVASPGGSGNGLLSCLEQLDRFSRHVGAAIFDYIGVNRWNSDYKREAAKCAAKAMAQGRKNGETVEIR